jgi:alpha-1,3-mannosyltransferase
LLQCSQRGVVGKRIFFNRPLTAPYITSTMFVSNFVGICFARTLHYQFYCWYFHAIPYLLWYSCSISSNNSAIGTNEKSGGYHLIVRLAIIMMIEIAFLTFPATASSSLMLQIAHFAVLIQIQPFTTAVVNEEEMGTNDNKAKLS